ncbi:MAG: DNA repair exonuclease [archaeon]
MRIGIVGDTHFGFSFGTERADDSYEEARRAIAAIVERKPDLIILPGDVFDSAVPRQEVLAKGAEILREFSTSLPGTGLNAVPAGRALPNGIPIVAIHGTHERRPKGFTNPLQVMEKAGVLVYLHGETLVLEKGPERIAITGIGGVPEEYFPEVLRKLSPKPVPGARNIFLFHQNVTDFLPGLVEGASLSMLPPGFDLYVDGHIHWGFQVARHGGGKVIFSGSTITTQIRKNEADAGKAVWLVDSETLGIERIPFEPFRRVFLAEAESIKDAVELLLKIPEAPRKPLVRLKLSGKETDFSQITGLFSEKFILSIERVGAEQPPQSGKEMATPEKVERKAAQILGRLLSGKLSQERTEEIYSFLLLGRELEASEALVSANARN